MKKKVLLISLTIMLISAAVYAGNGDLIVNGNLGVGATPGAKLDVAGSEGHVQVTADGAHLRFSRPATNYINATAPGGQFYFSVNGNIETSPALAIKSTGNVGIGTSNAFGLLTLFGAGTYSTNMGGQLIVTGENGTKRLNVGYDLVNNFAFLQAVENNVAYRNIIMQKNGGNVGIGLLNPSSRLDVAGDIAINGTVKLTSDSTFKRNTALISNPLEKVMALNGLSYEWKTNEYPERGFSEGRHYGVIAQEIEKVLPEVVSTAPDGMKSVAYTEIIPVLIEAIKEQQKEIELLKSKVEQLSK